MRKYIVSLIPFIFCTILSFIYGAKTPKQFPDPSYPYQTKGALAYLSTAWLYIGITISAVFISMFIISDLFDYVAQMIKKKRIAKYSKRD